MFDPARLESWEMKSSQRPSAVLHVFAAFSRILGWVHGPVLTEVSFYRILLLVSPKYLDQVGLCLGCSGALEAAHRWQPSRQRRVYVNARVVSNAGM